MQLFCKKRGGRENDLEPWANLAFSHLASPPFLFPSPDLHAALLTYGVY